MNWRKDARQKASQQGPDALFDSTSFKGGFSLCSTEDGFGLIDRSTRQHSSQDINPHAGLAQFYNLRKEYAYDTRYDSENKQFFCRKYTKVFDIRRSSIGIIRELIVKVINSALKKQGCVWQVYTNRLDCRIISIEENYNKEIRFSQENFADGLLTTIYVTCGYNDKKRGEFWSVESDFEIVSLALKAAKEKNIKLNLNQIPRGLRQYEFSLTALMFAAKKRDFENPDDRLKLVKLLLKNGADPQAVDEDGHDSIWYAQQYGHHEVVNCLTAQIAFKELIEDYEIKIINTRELNNTILQVEKRLHFLRNGKKPVLARNMEFIKSFFNPNDQEIKFLQGQLAALKQHSLYTLWLERNTVKGILSEASDYPNLKKEDQCIVYESLMNEYNKNRKSPQISAELKSVAINTVDFFRDPEIEEKRKKEFTTVVHTDRVTHKVLRVISKKHNLDENNRNILKYILEQTLIDEAISNYVVERKNDKLIISTLVVKIQQAIVPIFPSSFAFFTPKKILLQETFENEKALGVSVLIKLLKDKFCSNDTDQFKNLNMGAAPVTLTAPV